MINQNCIHEYVKKHVMLQDCSLPFSPESLVIPSTQKKMNRLEIKNYLACSSVWMRNFISHVKGRTRLELSENRQLEENTWSLKGGNNRRKAKLHNEVFHNLYSASYIIGMIKSKHARFEEHEACPAEIRNGKILVRKSERKSLFKTMDL